MSAHSSFSSGRSPTATPDRETASRHHHSRQHSSSSFDLADDPSFSSAHFVTSTPLKPGPRKSFNAEDALDADTLRASDTESLPGEDDLAEGVTSATRIRLTRRSLAEFSSSTGANAYASPQLQPSPARPFTSTSSPSNATAQPLLSSSMGRDFSNQSGARYAPTPSTGSSTLVEKDDYHGARYSSGGKGKGKGREDTTVRGYGARRGGEGIAEEPTPEDDGSSSSPRPQSTKSRRTPEELSSFLDAKVAAASAAISSAISTPPQPRIRYQQQLSAISTPIAPGAYPPTSRKPPPSRRSPSAHSPSHQQSTPITASSQVRDAFTRFITGPDGAITHSAERRALLAAQRQAATPSGSQSVRREPPTPHPAGFYPFTPTANEGRSDPRSSRSPLPRRAWGEATRGDGGEEDGDREDEEGAVSPSRRGRKGEEEAKLVKTLRHLRELQVETEGSGRQVEEEDLDRYFAPSGDEREEEELERAPKVRTRDYEGDYSSEDEGEEEELPGLGQRSTVRFAMVDSDSGSEGRPAPPTPAGANRPSPPSHTNLASSSRRSPPSTQLIPPTAPAPTSPRRRTFTPPPRSPSPPLPPPVPSPLSTPQSSPVKPLRPRIPGKYSTTPRRPPSEPSYSHSPASSTPPRQSLPPAPQPAQTPPRLPSPRLPASSPRASTSTEGALTRRRSSLSSSYVPEHSSRIEPVDDLAVRSIAAELLQAVKELSAPLDERGLPVRTGESLAGVLSRRKKESEGRRRELESEMSGLERGATRGLVSLVSGLWFVGRC